MKALVLGLLVKSTIVIPLSMIVNVFLDAISYCRVETGGVVSRAGVHEPEGISNTSRIVVSASVSKMVA